MDLYCIIVITEVCVLTPTGRYCSSMGYKVPYCHHSEDSSGVPEESVRSGLE